MPKPRRPRTKRLRPVKENCIFCKEKKEPSYRESELLRRYITERGKIIPRTRSGICAKHQRKISVAVKHARHLALLPFVAQV